MKRLLGQERIGDKIQRDWLHYDDDGREVFTTETIQDIEPLVKANREQFNAAPQTGGGDMRKIADIPGVVISELCRVHKIPFRELMEMRSERSVSIWNRFLNSPEFRAFRTRPGRVDVRRG